MKKTYEQLEQENAKLTAERDAANDEARQMQERLTRVVEGHKALTAELSEERSRRVKVMGEMEMELAAKNERLEYLEGQDRSLLEQHQASMITLGDSDLLAVGGRLLDRAEEAEAKLAEAEQKVRRIDEKFQNEMEVTAGYRASSKRNLDTIADLRSKLSTVKEEGRREMAREVFERWWIDGSCRDFEKWLESQAKGGA